MLPGRATMGLSREMEAVRPVVDTMEPLDIFWLVNVTKIQGLALDQEYLQKWAQVLGLTQLLAKAWRVAEDLDV